METLTPSARAHLMTSSLLLGILVGAWFILSHPQILLWLVTGLLIATVYYLVFLFFRSRSEGIETEIDAEK